MTKRLANPKHVPGERLVASDLDDIAKYLPVHGTAWVAEYIGCTESTVRKHAALLGVPLSTKAAPRRGRPDSPGDVP